jgi:molybdopterin synthase catalytic subunit
VSGAVRLIGLRSAPLDMTEVCSAVDDAAAGGVAVFVGTVREHDAGRQVTGLGYSAHPAAEDQLREVAERTAAEYPVVAVAALHRVGDLGVGDVAVVVAASSAHRGDAFSACRHLIDDLKASVAIWKHQVFTDGTEEWVGTP